MYEASADVSALLMEDARWLADASLVFEQHAKTLDGSEKACWLLMAVTYLQRAEVLTKRVEQMRRDSAQPSRAASGLT